MTRYVATNQSQLVLSVYSCPDLYLTGEDDGAGFILTALDDSTTWGNPVPIDTAVQRWMTDGAVAATQGHDNREISFKVQITAETSADLAAGETALALRVAQPCLLSWTPPEGSPNATTSVFEVWTWHFDHLFDGLDERNMKRTYQVTMTAKPWVRSASLTTSAASPAVASPTILSIDTCASTTGWTGSPVAVTTSGGAVRESKSEVVSGRGLPLNVYRTLSRNTTVTGLGSLPYLILDMSTTGAASTVYTVTVVTTGGLSSAPLTEAAVIGSQHYYVLPSGMTSFGTLNVTAAAHVTTSGTVALAIADVSATDTIGGIGSHKQLIRAISIGGSVPTSGSLHLSGSGALGTVLCHTTKEFGTGFTPPLRQYRTSGNTVTADATAVSSNREAVITSGSAVGLITYQIPANILPEASYAVVGRFFSTGTNTLTPTASAVLTLGDSQVVTGAPVTWATANTYQWVVVGVLSLPSSAIPVESSSTVQTVSLTATGTGTTTLDELYLLDITHGAVSLVSCGATATHLWLEAPDADIARNRPQVYIGTSTDRSDAARPSSSTIRAIGEHSLDPAGAVLLTVTDTVNDANAEATYYHRWHSHPED